MNEPKPKRCCGNCAFAERPTTRWLRIILSRWPGLLICFHCPKAPGEMCEVAAHHSCPNYRPRRRPVVRTEPPQPESDDVRYIPLTQGKHAIVDAADYPELSRYKWYALAPSRDGRFYAVRKEKGQTVLMHRQIMNPPDGMVVDHIDGNSLYNRRRNLRICTPFQNAQNQRRPKRGESKFVGVYRVGDKWEASVGHRGRTYYVGRFDDEVEAAKARDAKKLELAGEYAGLNFPPEADAP
jgi:hypothetical protein